MPFLVLYLTESLGMPARRAGLVLSCYGIGSLVTAPVAGRLADRLGSESLMKLSLFVSGTVLLLFPMAHTLPAVLALTLSWAITSEAFRPASLAAIAHAVGPRQRRAAFALLRLAINLGMSIGPVVGGFLVRVSYPAVFRVNGTMSILAGVLLVGWSVRGAAPHGVVPEESPRATRSVVFDPRLLFFLLALLPSAMVFFQLTGTLPLYAVRSLGLPESSFGFLLAVNTVLILLVEVPLNQATASWSHRRALALGAFLTGLGFGALVLAHDFLSAAATVVVWTFGEMILFPASSAYVADLAPAERRGTYMGLYQMTFSLALTVGSSLGPWTLDRYGAGVLWSGAFACGILSAILLSRVFAAPRPGSSLVR